jgi:N-acetylglutamate synthase-like GNAT family acetyltransferase
MPDIRDATEADLHTLLQLMAQLNETPSGLADAHREAFRVVESDPRQRLLVVEHDNSVVASAVMVIVPNIGHGGRPYCLVENVVVDEPSRGSGIGAMLMRYIIEQAEAAGCYTVPLTSRHHRTEAHAFYKRLGFEATSVGFRYTLVPD